jgi:Na+-driven multidrug efflux pump
MSRFSWPILAELLLNFVVSLVLYRLLGKIADAASGAIGAVSGLFSLFQMFFLGLSQAGGILIANSCGRGSEDLAARQRGTLLVIFAVSIIAVLLALHTARPVLVGSILGLSGKTAEFAIDYSYIAQWTLILQAVTHFMTALYRSLGNSLLPFIISLLNNSFVLAFLWLLPARMAAAGITGVESAALCQLSGSAISLLISLSLFFFMIRAPIELPNGRTFAVAELRAILLLTSMVVLEPVAYSISQVAIGRYYAMLGENALAARAYVNTLAAVPSLLGIALGWAAQIQVSYLFGAGQIDRARQTVLRSSRITMLVGPWFAATIFAFSEKILAWFTLDKQVAADAAILLGCFVLLEIGRSVNTTVAPALKAVGSASYVARSAFVVMLFICVPAAWYMSFPMRMGILGLGLACAFDELLRGWLNLRRWLKVTLAVS